jgi:methyl-accepting chemotaxis protein
MGMRLFSRLVIGYLTIFALVTAGSVFAIVQLYRLNDLTHSLQSIENRIVNYGKDLTDAMLAQVRFETKYVITRDKGLTDQFRLSERHFQKLLSEERAIDLPNELQERLKQIQERHKQYLRLFNNEQAFIQAAQTYDEQVYLREKEAVADWIIAELDAINRSSRQDIDSKFEQLEVIGSRATRVAILVTGISLVLGIVLSLIITRSITRPVGRLEEKTREIARGDFAGMSARGM